MPIPFETNINSATTLSIRPQPGKEKRLVASKSDAIFSFGDFTIEKNYSLDVLTSSTQFASFGTFDNLETLNAVNLISSVSSTFVQQNELNLPKRKPKSHSYFSSFYTSVASAINRIISDYPYAILSYNNGNVNIFDYSEHYDNITFETWSVFKIPTSGLTNQSNIILTSANTPNNYSLSYDYKQFCVQLSGQTEIHKIKNYSFSGTYLYFEVSGLLMGGNSSPVFTKALYIRPTIERMYNYNDSITSLETQLLGEGIFAIPNTETTEDDYINKQFIWPRTIDGFAPDSYGSNFETYKDKILVAAERVDEEKTDIFIKTVIPENYLELDSNGQIYRSIIQTYAYEFDKLKNYIDAIAYAHSVEYNNEETVPRKFMMKLGTLLGWKLSDGFSELDLFDYLTSDLDQSNNSFSYFNVEIWRRILINIVWLYKKKGTRDAITFIFKLLGAPDCLINFNEFVYDIVKTAPNVTSKVDTDGYINYSESLYIFQQGGINRGNGYDYINQWRPEFDPLMRVDNIKIEVGDPIDGTRSIVNTKEVGLEFAPTQAIECDVWQYFQQPCASWMWGSPCPSFSCMTIPFEFLTFTQEDVQPINIAAMTLSQYIDYVYTNSINPTNRKTNAQCHTVWGYPELKNIYLSYYYATCPDSNSLTMCKLESYIQLLEVQLGDYMLQLVPATTIFNEHVPTTYKNPVFHRERFVYREGVDKGSMFRRDSLEPVIGQFKYCSLSDVKIIIPTQQNVFPFKFSCQKIETKEASIKALNITCSVNTKTVNSEIGAVIATASIISSSQQLVAE